MYILTISYIFNSYAIPSPDLSWNPQISTESTYKADRLIKLMSITIKGIQNEPVEYPQLVIPDSPASSGFSGSGSETPDEDENGKDDDDNGGVSGNGSGLSGLSGSGTTDSFTPEDKVDGGTTAATSDNTPTLSVRPVTDAIALTDQVETLPATTPTKSVITTGQKASQSSTQKPTSKSTTSSMSSSKATVKATVNNQQLNQDSTTTSDALAIQSNSILTTTSICCLVYAIIHFWL